MEDEEQCCILNAWDYDDLIDFEINIEQNKKDNLDE